MFINLAVSLKLPFTSQKEIRQWYKRNYRRDVTVNSLHLSLLFSFQILYSDVDTIKNNINDFNFRPLVLKTSDLVVYTATEKPIVALIFDVRSAQRVKELHTHLETHLSQKFGGQLNYDTEKFKDKKLPEYEPHISLEYEMPVLEVAELELVMSEPKEPLTINLNREDLVLFFQRDGEWLETRVDT